MKRLTIIALAVFTAFSLHAQGTWSQEFSERYDSSAVFLSKMASQIYGGSVRPAWKDSVTFLYRMHEKSGDNIYSVNTLTKTRTLSSMEELRSIRPGAPYYDPSDETMYSLSKQKEFPSPNGKCTALIRDDNIWIKAEDGSLRQLSFDGTELEPYHKVMWSPDGKKIAASRKQKMEERQIILRNSRPEDQIQPEYRYLNYCKPGDALPQETPYLYDLAAMARIPFSTEAYSNQYFLEMGQWSPDSKYFTFEYNQRGHQLYQLIAVDAATGRNRILAEEKTDTFVYYYDIYRYYFEDGKRILWTSERDDWRHLYMIDVPSGTMKLLTPGEWNVREVQHVDEKKGYVLMYVNGLNASKGEDPYNKHLVRLDLKTLKIKDLTPENANHTVFFDRGFDTFVDNASRPDFPGESWLRSAKDGSRLMELSHTDISVPVENGYTMPEVFCAKGRDGVTDIWGTIFRPYNFDPSKKYPVVEYIYAGPHDSHVEKNFYGNMRFSRLMEMGFVVVTIDGMGTDNRTKSFQDVAWRNIKDAGFPDRILWMKAAAAKYPSLDISNVGIYGYSAGGQNTLSALLFHPEFYKVGVALCGCHDNRMDKMWWNEQWMGYPVGPWYSENSNVDNAWRLEGKLFIINGEIDDNVDPASSLQVVYELEKHNKYFEQMHLAAHTHNLGNDYITKRVFEFFWRNR